MPELLIDQAHSGQEFKQAGLEAARGVLSHSALRPFAQVLERWMEGDFARLGRTIPPAGDRFFQRFLENLHMRYACAAEDTARIPRTGPVILTANHPFGFAEGVLLGALLDEIRPDFQFMANSLLLAVPQLREYVIPINPYGGPDAIQENRTSLRRAIACLQAGGLLVAFPAGDVASFQFGRLGIRDKEWTSTVARLARKANASVVPVFFHGANSAAFHMAGLVHERLRTVLLPREFLNKQDKKHSHFDRQRHSARAALANWRYRGGHGISEVADGAARIAPRVAGRAYQCALERPLESDSEAGARSHLRDSEVLSGRR